ncbi:MAG: hypothetical protein ACQR33_05855 [Candidatus Saccharibacteria bacterium]
MQWQVCVTYNGDDSSWQDSKNDSSKMQVRSHFCTYLLTTLAQASPNAAVFLSQQPIRVILKAMLQLSNSLINRPVMSLRTGTQVATALWPIINPNTLRIEGFVCQDGFKKGNQLILVNQDVRDLIPQGIVINDHDVLTEPTELVRLQKVIALHFQLIGKHVITQRKSRLGKVEDYAIDIASMYIQKLYVSQPLFKNFSGGNLGIDRTQIVEVTDKKIVVQDLLEKMPAGAKAVA